MKLNLAMCSFVLVCSLAACDQLSAPQSKETAPGRPVDVAVSDMPSTLSMKTLPALTAELSSTPPEGIGRLGGNLDSLTLSEDGTRVILFGWALIKAEEPAPRLTIYAPDVIEVVSINRVERPDVSLALNDETLRFSGFELSLTLTPDRDLSTVCITTRDQSYGEHLVGMAAGQPLVCPITPINE